VWGFSAHYFGGIFKAGRECELRGKRGDPVHVRSSTAKEARPPHVELLELGVSLHRVVLL
jgi:hypothetical protein